jgi:hypothetical protein
VLDECATCIPARCGPRFECGDHGPADAAKPRIRGDVVQAYHARIGDRSDREDAVAFHCDQDGVIGPCDPLGDDLGRLVGQPLRQDCRIISMIGGAKLHDGSSEHLAGGRRIVGDGVSDVHAGIIVLSGGSVERSAGNRKRDCCTESKVLNTKLHYRANSRCEIAL